MLVAILLSTASTAGAQELDPGEIVITVTDAQTRQPVADADVFLLGAESPVSSLTNGNGLVTFGTIPPGTYRLSVSHNGYDRYEVSAFDVEPHQRVTISVAMMPELKTIANVRARASASVSTEDVNQNSAERKVSGTLGEALNKLAGVSVDQYPSTADSAFNVSLRNHDASQTGYSLDGIRIVGPAGGLLSASQDLFTGASVSFAPTAGYLGGNINFQTLRPSKLWTYDLNNTFGNYSAQTNAIAVTGTKGRLGIAVQHVFTSADSFVSGMRYKDQSGTSYSHVGGNTASGNLMKLDYTVNKRTSLLFTGLFSHGTYDPICTDYTTLLPCGYGPGSTNDSHNSYATLAVKSLVGNVDASLSLFSPFGKYGYDYPGRTLNGTLSPYFSHGSYWGSGADASASITSHRHTDTIGAFFSQFGGNVSRSYDGGTLAIDQPVQRFETFGFSDKVKANEKLALTHALSLQSATGAGKALVISETADWTPNKSDTFEGSASAGSAQPTYADQFPITDALQSDVDCYNRSMYIDGPGDRAVRQSSISYDLSWRHTFTGGFISADVYRQNAFGQNLRMAVPILAEPSDIFAAGMTAFLQQAQGVWSSPAVCGSIPFDPHHVYISQLVTGVGQVNQGFTLSGRVGLGRYLAAFPTLAVGSTYLSSLDARLLTPGSYYGIGRQLPHHPLRTAGLTLDGLLPRAKLEWLVNAQFTSINNSHDLPAYTTYNAGLVFQSHAGSLTLLESNIFGTRSGLFSTYEGINPMPVIGGGTFAFASTPLPPRQWQLTWNIHWHQHADHKKR